MFSLAKSEQDLERDTSRKPNLGTFSPAIAKRISRLHPGSSGRAEPLTPSLSRLTSHQMEVLQLIAEGKANKQMAAEPGLGMKTVEKHREHLMQKLDIHDTARLSSYIIPASIVEKSGNLAIE